jgi:tRNA1Val (adenine37-N6)-methyltransferase
MANSWFQFKHFKIVQDKCAMKVGTDGVLLGAWVPLEGARRILDVGSGTGLIALMLAQRAPEADITAVEIDQDACLQSVENIQQSPWFKRLKVVNTDFRHFSQGDDGLFDLIVTNPPYFVGSQPSSGEARSIARHTTLLGYNELIEGVVRRLKPEGRLALILPATPIAYAWFSIARARSSVSQCSMRLSGQFAITQNRFAPRRTAVRKISGNRRS